MEIEIINKVMPQITPHENKQEKPNPTPQNDQIVVDKIEAEKSLSDKELKSLIRELKKEMQPYSKRFKLQVDKEIDRVVVKVIDKNTDKIIKEIPSVEIQQMIASIRRALGMLFNKEI